MTDEHNPEAVARLIADCTLAAKCMADKETFPTGQAILKEAADMLEALAAKLAEAEASLALVTAGRDTHKAGREAAEAELSRLRTAQDAMVGAVIEDAAVVCVAQAQYREDQMKNTSAPREQWQRWMAGKIQAGLILEAILALRPDATASLQRMLREARNAALDRAADEAEEHKLFAKGIDCLPDCIRAMKEQPDAALVAQEEGKA